MIRLGKQSARFAGLALFLLVVLWYLSANAAVVRSRVWRPNDSAQWEEHHNPTSATIAEPVKQEATSRPNHQVQYVPSVASFWDAKPSSRVHEQTADPSHETQSPTPTPSLRKTIVMGKLSSEKTDWVHEELPDWENAIYVVDVLNNQTSPTGYQTRFNKAKETTPYLTYIVEHYDNLPDVAVFMHSHRDGWPQAWHNDVRDHDAVTLLRNLQLNVVREQGYTNMRCNTEVGCPAQIVLENKPNGPERQFEQAYPAVFAQFFNITEQQVKEQVPVIAVPCCAQFALSKKQILRKPKSEYERYLRLIEVLEYDDDTLGRVMEYMWHIIFGKSAVHCPSSAQCYATVYGGKHGGYLDN